MPAMLPACDALPALRDCLVRLLLLSVPPAPSATTSLLPLARLSFVLSATAPNTDTGEVPLTPPLL